MLEKGGAWRAEEARGGTLDFQAACREDSREELGACQVSDSLLWLELRKD